MHKSGTLIRKTFLIGALIIVFIITAVSLGYILYFDSKAKKLQSDLTADLPIINVAVETIDGQEALEVKFNDYFSDYKNLFKFYDTSITLNIYESGAVLDSETNEKILDQGYNGDFDSVYECGNGTYSFCIYTYDVNAKTDFNNVFYFKIDDTATTLDENQANLKQQDRIYNFCLEIQSESISYIQYYDTANSYYRYEDGKYRAVQNSDLNENDVFLMWIDGELRIASYDDGYFYYDTSQTLESENTLIPVKRKGIVYDL